MSFPLTRRSIAMRTTVWVLGILLSLPSHTLEVCGCLQALASVCTSCTASAPDAAAHRHPVVTPHRGSDCPCQCHHDTPQQSSIVARESRSTDDVDIAIRFATCSQQVRRESTAQDLFSGHAGGRPAIPALMRCATLSRFLL
ncbi:hypothetical protein M4951_16185 [Blastopirellula sp. J2-11]|uniref:hypothetical protein n=1 Tax=Blastopirellula sp. J2-11 TaxID=2943192 RepID=UPI0021C5F16E|nr:hypothetical protein [Blastopirellula sp. J2-11]UUO04921.1 hypothetical protein M4951_16185 [Blastopirellula sp. J2-11]